MPLLRFIPEATDINFVGARYIAFAIDGLLLLISIISIAVQGFNLSIDFKGGIVMEVKAAQVYDVGKLRADIGSLNLGDPEIQTYTGGGGPPPRGSCVMIRMPHQIAKPGQDQSTLDQATVADVKAK